LAVAAALTETEAGLWPQARPDLTAGSEATSEVVAAYAHRADIPRPVWTALLAGARERIDLLGYAYPFIAELLPDAVARIADTATNGTMVRMAFADPDCLHVTERDSLEQIGGTLPGRIRNALNFLQPLHGHPGVRIGLHTVHLYNSIFRFDHQMIITPYLYRARGYQHPALHLRELSPHGMFAAYAHQFDQIWQTTTPYPAREVPISAMTEAMT
jgi:hypothetical protein